MKKAALLIALITVCAAFSACGSSDASDTKSKSEEKTAVSSQADEEPAEDTEDTEQSSADDTAASAEAEPQEDTASAAETESEAPVIDYTRKLDRYLINLEIPGQFRDLLARDRGLFRETLDSGEEVYFSHNGRMGYEELNGTDYTIYDVPEILKPELISDIDIYYPTDTETLLYTVETEEEREVLGCTFIYRTGIMHTEIHNQQADLHFAGYFGRLYIKDFELGSDYEPIQWLAFCETDDPEIIKYLEELVQNAAENAVYKDY